MALKQVIEEPLRSFSIPVWKVHLGGKVHFVLEIAS